MFWNKKGKGKVAPVRKTARQMGPRGDEFAQEPAASSVRPEAVDALTEPSAALPIGSADHSIDTLAHLLRSYGEHAFDVGEIRARDVRERCEGLAREISVGSVDKDGPTTVAARNWRAVRTFVGEHRRTEGAYVKRTLTDLRDVVWTFIRGWTKAARRDQLVDRDVSKQLAKLQLAAEGTDTGLLKQEAVNAVDIISALMERRKDGMRDQMRSLTSRLQNLSDDLLEPESEAVLDPLTQLYNRIALDEHLTRSVDLCDLLGQSSCLLLIDVDDFTEVNHKNGTNAGDVVLKSVAKGCLRCFPRKSDFVARSGDDEFAIVMAQDSEVQAQEFAEQLLKVVRDQEVKFGDKADKGIFTTISMGMAMLAEGESVESWLGRAEEALQDARRGRGRLVQARGFDSAGLADVVSEAELLP